MVLITKLEAKEMRKRCGKHQVFHTYGKHKHYYLVESPKNMEELNNYRDTRTIVSSEWSG